MSFDDSNINERRRVLKFLGTSAALVPLASLTACGGGDDAAPAAAKPDTAKPEAAMESAAESMESTMESAEETMDAAADKIEEAADDMASKAAGQDLPLIAESDPQAKALAYVEDATTVDASKSPRYKPGQACSNCALYMGGDKAQGACSIFPGKAVKATGWCSVYAPKG